MQFTAAISANGKQRDVFAPAEAMPGMVEDAVNKCSALVDKRANVFTFAEAVVKLGIDGIDGILEYRDRLLCFKIFQELAFVKK